MLLIHFIKKGQIHKIEASGNENFRYICIGYVPDKNNDIVSFGDYYVNFISNKKVIIEGCKSVTDYSEALISLNLGKRIISLLGSNIQIISYTENEIIVTGTFSKLEFGE